MEKQNVKIPRFYIFTSAGRIGPCCPPNATLYRSDAPRPAATSAPAAPPWTLTLAAAGAWLRARALQEKSAR